MKKPNNLSHHHQTQKLDNPLHQKFRLIEALMFIQGEEGLSVKTVQEVCNFDKIKARQILLTFMEYFNKQSRGLEVITSSDIFYLVTRSQFFDDISKLVTKVKKIKLSNAALEVIGIIAYKGPLTKTQINEIRQVSSEPIVNTLLTKGLITETGLAKTPGQPILYYITPKFFDYFGIKSLDELPALKEFDYSEGMDHNFDLFSSQYEVNE